MKRILPVLFITTLIGCSIDQESTEQFNNPKEELSIELDDSFEKELIQKCIDRFRSLPTNTNSSLDATCKLVVSDSVLHYDPRLARFVLINHSGDTLSFLTTSCDGVINQLIYDCSLLSISSLLACNVSYPKLMKISPGDSISIGCEVSSNENLSTFNAAINLPYGSNEDLEIEWIMFNELLQDETRERILWLKEFQIP